MDDKSTSLVTLNEKVCQMNKYNFQSLVSHVKNVFDQIIQQHN